MRPKQSERLEDIQKKYPNANRLDNNENLAEGEQEEYIVNIFIPFINFKANYFKLLIVIKKIINFN
jgi:hypothetical protein